MKYSIVVPVHNVEKYIKRCIESVLSQTYPDFELLLINDGSDDRSGEICDIFKRNDHRVRVLHQICKGVSEARNRGIAESCGEYLIFLDADDYWTTDKALEIIDNNINQQVDLLRFGFMEVTYDEKKIKKKHDKENDRIVGEYSTGNEFIISALKSNPEFSWYSVLYVYRRSLWDNEPIIRFPVGVRYLEDTAVVYKIISRASKTIVIKDCLYAYRKHDETVSSEESLEVFCNRIDISKNNILEIEKDTVLSDEARALLLPNMAVAFYTSLIHVEALPKEERPIMLSYLKTLSPVFTKYPATKKQRIVNTLIKLFGMRYTSHMLNIRRCMRKMRREYSTARI